MQENRILAGQKAIFGTETRAKDGILVPKNIRHKSSEALSLKLLKISQTTTTTKLLLSKLNRVVTIPILLFMVFPHLLPALRYAIITSSQEFRHHPFSLMTMTVVHLTIQVRPVAARPCPTRLQRQFLLFRTIISILILPRLTQIAVVAMTKPISTKIEPIRTGLPLPRSAHVAQIPERLTLLSL